MQSNSSKRVIDLSQEPNDDGDTKRSRNDDYNTSFSNDEDYAMAVQAAFDQEREHEGNEYENENDMVIEKISRDRSYSDSESELDIKRAGTGIEELKWQPMYLLRSQYVTSDIHNNKCLSLNDLFTHTSPISSYTGSCGSIEEVVASTYLFKLEELYQEMPNLCQANIPVLLLHGEKGKTEQWHHQYHYNDNANSNSNVMDSNQEKCQIFKNLIQKPFFAWRFVEVNLDVNLYGKC